MQEKQNDNYEQKHRDENTGICKVTIKSNDSRTIYARLEVVEEKAGEIGVVRSVGPGLYLTAKWEPKEI